MGCPSQEVIMYIAAKILLISLFTVQAESQGCISSNMLTNFSTLCSSRSVYNYTTLDQFQQIFADLTLAFANLMFDIRDFCYPSVQTYMCDYFFPPCVTQNNIPQVICEVSCDNYLHNGVCTSFFTDLLSFLTTINSSIIELFNKNCSASLQPLYGIETRELGCNHLNGIPYTNGTVECSPVPPNDVFCRSTFRYSHFSSAVTSQLNIHIERISLLSLNASISQECTDFIAFYQCIGTYTPCDPNSMKIYTFCEDICSIINKLAFNCFDFTRIDRALLQYFTQFNCSNPLTFTSSLTLDYYESLNDEICSALRAYFGDNNDASSGDNSANGLTNGQIIGIIIGALSLVTLTLMIIISVIIVLFKQRNKSSINIVLRKDNMFTVNPQYDLTLTKTSQVANKDGLVSTIYNDDLSSPATVVSHIDDNVENIITPYQQQLAPLLIKTSDFVIGEEIGHGAFGKVFKGIFYSSNETDLVVAIKTIRTSDWSPEDMKSFLLESSKMSELHHPNVLELVGICFEDKTPYMLLPYMANGDLKQFLLSRRVSEEDVTVYPEGLNENVFLGMILDIAKGMEYLATLHFIHRDLAARNCMVDDNLLVKIADFGLSRDVYESSYYVLRHAAKLPVRWMALESLLDGCFNLKSDVAMPRTRVKQRYPTCGGVQLKHKGLLEATLGQEWSYGVTCWEIFSLGRQPYPGISHSEISEYLSSGHRLIKPHLCPTSLYTLMTTCWEVRSDDRPTFAELVTKIDKLKELKANMKQMGSGEYVTSTFTF